MMRSLFSGVSGLKTHQTKMDVIGNNISNVNTVAFKSSSTTFSDIMYQTTQQASGATATRGGVNAKQIGLGVTNGATKVSITSSGSAQSTGDALDLRLTDTKSTNFFIVSNGQENVFTRAGSFYVDGNGNLAMTTTGYLVQGWQVQDDGTIKKDTVSALRVMQPSNLTSEPEATSAATFSGVIDKNDTNVSSKDGYIRAVTIYDSLGYAYTAKFAIRVTDKDKGTYSVELNSILDADGNDIYKEYIEETKATTGDALLSKANIFGKGGYKVNSYGLKSGYTLTKEDDGSTTITTQATIDGTSYTVKTNIPKGTNPGLTDELTFTDGATPTPHSVKITVADMFDISDEDKTIIEKYGIDTPTTNFSDVSKSSEVKASYHILDANYSLNFSTADGTLETVTGRNLTYTPGAANAPGTITVAGEKINYGGENNIVTLHTSLLGPNRAATTEENAALSDIQIDLSQLLNYDNGGTSTVTPARGDKDGTTGAGKKLGTMTGLSISNDGKIFGSYSNGNTELLGQIAVAQFSNASGLEELGNNCYGTTLNSGDFDGIGIDVSADGSSISTGQLEMSNVDLSSEFTDMIVTQRGFQANSRIITVSDTLLEELINLKR